MLLFLIALSSDSSLAVLALFLRLNPECWTLLDEIVVDDTSAEERAAVGLSSWAIDIVSGEGVWAPPGAFQAEVSGVTSAERVRSVRLYGRYVGEDG